jgi:plasmid stability protein
MAQVLIRAISQDVIESYREQARSKGSSLEQELRETLIRHRPVTPKNRVDAMQAFRREHGLIKVSRRPEDLIREDRDGR